MCKETFIKTKHYIKCTECGMTSFNPNDMFFEYCSNCDSFHDVLLLKKEAKEWKQENKLKKSFRFRFKKRMENWLSRLYKK